MATILSLDKLLALLSESAGEDESIDYTGDILDMEFEALGYDSLAMFNTVNRVERDYGISVGDDIVANAKTPRLLLAEINERLRAVG
ncbi:acyl carrier protein [Amycolatopsis orientalis]|uniref:Actinorhodin polyketide synthase n=1 Tax=Amycolatopsis orientalis TaxID=31958 RepID=A0A193C6Q2_AMYOR|nr:acyl carrier protein [Amycolatopsis orientalis]ANN20162.1 actinorhodin polyketide synthase [Amycolatopsis orientalis]